MVNDNKREAIRRRDRGEDSLAEIGRSYNVSGLEDFEAQHERRAS